MKPILETERLILRQLTLDDSDFTMELLNTEGYIKYIANRHVTTREKAQDYLLNGPLKSYEMHGFGLSLVALKDTLMPIGMCGLLKRDYLEHPDIGYAFLPQFNGRGYAFEMAEKVIQIGFSQLNQEKIVAITLPTNAPSIKLLERLGLTYERTIAAPDSGEKLLLFGINGQK